MAMPPIPKDLMNPLHPIELIVRGINRRFESYGKIKVKSMLDLDDTLHLSEYTTLHNKLYKLNRKYRNLNLHEYIRVKGDYIQISRSKESLKVFNIISTELNEILKDTPTYQDAINKIKKEENVKTNKVAKEILIENTQVTNALNDSAFLDELYEASNEEVLNVFRGVEKGGLREKGHRLSSEEWEFVRKTIRR